MYCGLAVASPVATLLAASCNVRQPSFVEGVRGINSANVVNSSRTLLECIHSACGFWVIAEAALAAGWPWSSADV
jgi:hypothetical protein